MHVCESRQQPSRQDWKALLQITVHMNASKEMSLRFVRGTSLKLSVYGDADRVAASNDRRSVFDVTMMSRDTAVSWKSSTNKYTTATTCEAEYVALSDTPTEVLFIRVVLAFL